uniref:Cyclic nucleotide-binding domain-containing protein n=1 Tax=Steinernema glaseri TaxID=37863 RepID=A0A1I7Y6D0_9BILA
MVAGLLCLCDVAQTSSLFLWTLPFFQTADLSRHPRGVWGQDGGFGVVPSTWTSIVLRHFAASDSSCVFRLPPVLRLLASFSTCNSVSDANFTMDQVIQMLPEPLKKISTHYDFVGQKRAERIYQVSDGEAYF